MTSVTTANPSSTSELSDQPPRRTKLASPYSLVTYNHSNQLPYPAVKLVIGQHFWIHPDCRSFAWLVVGAFYDRADNVIWQIEVRLGAPEIDPDSYLGELIRDYANPGRGTPAYEIQEILHLLYG